MSTLAAIASFVVIIALGSVDTEQVEIERQANVRQNCIEYFGRPDCAEILRGEKNAENRQLAPLPSPHYSEGR